MKKIVFVFVAIVVLAAMIAVPVSAADSGWTTINVLFDNVLYFSDYPSTGIFNYTFDGTLDSNGTHYNYDLVSGFTDITALSRLTGYTFNLQQGDVVQIPELLNYTGWLGGGDGANKITGYAWGVCTPTDAADGKYPYQVHMRSGWRSVNLSSPVHWKIEPVQGVTLTAPRNLENCSVCLLLRCDITQDAVFSMNNRNFSISFGNPNSPLRPNFQPPDTEQVDEYTELEGEVLDSISGGLTDVEGSFSNVESHFLRLGAALTGANKIFDIAFSEITFWTPLLYISLALGFLAFILGLLPMGARLLNRDSYKDINPLGSRFVERKYNRRLSSGYKRWLSKHG